MSKGRPKKAKKTAMLILNVQIITRLLGDLELYDRVPVLLPLRDRVIRLRDQIECRVHTGIIDVQGILRQRTEELMEAFRQIMDKQLHEGDQSAFEALKQLLRERHGIDAYKLVFHDLDGHPNIL